MSARTIMAARIFVVASGLHPWTMFLLRPIKFEPSPRILAKWEVVDQKWEHIN
jgi:hypothetical protein